MPDSVVIASLKQFDTPTICNALELVVPERRAEGFTTQPFFCHDPLLAPMVGYARTAKIRAHPQVVLEKMIYLYESGTSST